MPKKQPMVEVQPHQVGDKILWKGIPLTVTEVFPDGSVEAMSQTMRVHVETHEQFERVSHYGG